MSETLTRKLTDVIREAPRLEMTCNACPSQWEGATTRGEYLYIRVRHGSLTVDIDHRGVFFADVSDQFDGVMSLDEVLERIGDAEIAVSAERSEERPAY